MMIAVVSCSKRKQSYPCTAVEMYGCSVLFKKAISYCHSKKYDCIYILSCKYNLLRLDDQIEPYDLTINDLTKKQKQDWAAKTTEMLGKAVTEQDTVDFFCGKHYLNGVIQNIKNARDVLRGLGIGERLRFLGK